MIFIDFFAWLGWATDLKTVPDHVVIQRVLRTGDGSHPASIEALKKNPHLLDFSSNNNDGERDLDHFWGWVSVLLPHSSFSFNAYLHFQLQGDSDMTDEDKQGVQFLHKHHD
jgi:hypothetical protein